MTRRSLLRRVILTLGIDPLGLMGCLSRRDANVASPPVGAAAEQTPTAGPLSGSEMEDLVALGEVLVEGRTLPPIQRRYLIEFIEDRTMRSSRYLSLYRTTVSTLNRLAGRRFATLGVSERTELVARYRLAAWQGSPEQHVDPLPVEMETLRTRTVPDLIRGYYASPAGWAVVGYDTFPGRCGDLIRYTLPERS